MEAVTVGPSGALGSLLDEPERAIEAVCAELAGAERAVAVLLVSEQRLRTEAAVGLPAWAQLDDLPISADAGAPGNAALKRRTSSGPWAWCPAGSEDGQCLATPILVDDELVGVLVLVGSAASLRSELFAVVELGATMVGLALAARRVGSDQPGDTRLRDATEQALAGGASSAAVAVVSVSSDSEIEVAGVVVRGLMRPIDTVIDIDARRLALVCPLIASPADTSSLVSRLRRQLEASGVVPGIAAVYREAHVPVDEILVALSAAGLEAFPGATVIDAGPVVEVESPGVDEIIGAIDRDEIAPYFQPLIDLSTGHLIGFEALARWVRTDGSVVPPDFVPVLEEAGQISRLTRHMLMASCRQMGQWVRSGLIGSDVHLSVNASATEIHQPGFVELVEEVLERTGLAPNRLTIELTETAALTDRVAATAVMARLVAMGVGLAIDDYGTGHASVSYLRSLPLTMLKIDASFVAEVAHDPGCQAQVDTMVGLAHQRGASVLAEGIETTEQRDQLVRLGVQLGQGYLWARPTPATQVPDLVAHLKSGGQLPTGKP